MRLPSRNGVMPTRLWAYKRVTETHRIDKARQRPVYAHRCRLQSEEGLYIFNFKLVSNLPHLPPLFFKSLPLDPLKCLCLCIHEMQYRFVWSVSGYDCPHLAWFHWFLFEFVDYWICNLHINEVYELILFLCEGCHFRSLFIELRKCSTEKRYIFFWVYFSYLGNLDSYSLLLKCGWLFITIYPITGECACHYISFWLVCLGQRKMADIWRKKEFVYSTKANACIGFSWVGCFFP